MTASARILSAAELIRRHEHDVHAESVDKLKAFAAAVVARRTALGITRRILAGRVKISYGQLSHIENAENWPTMPVYLRIAKELKCGKVPLV